MAAAHEVWISEILAGVDSRADRGFDRFAWATWANGARPAGSVGSRRHAGELEGLTPEPREPSMFGRLFSREEPKVSARHEPQPKGAAALGPSAHVDTFTRDNLPPAEQWPDLLLDRPSSSIRNT